MRDLRRRKLLYGCLLFAITLCGWQFQAQATPARMDGLNNSPFFQDDIDVLFYPGLLTQRSNMVLLNVGSGNSRTQGSGGVLWGRKLGLGVFFNRGIEESAKKSRYQSFSDIAETSRLLGLGFSKPQRIFDLVGGLQLNRRMSLGASFGVSTTLASEFNLGGSSRNNRTTGQSATTFELNLGMSTYTDTMKLDVGLELSLNSFRQVVSDEVKLQSAGLPSFGLRSRAFFRMNRMTDLAFEVLISRRNYGANNPISQSTGAYSRWIAEAIIGPVIRIAGKGKAKQVSQPKPKPAKRSSGGDDDDNWDEKKGPDSAPKPARNWKLPPIAATFTGGLILGYEVVGGSTSFEKADLNEAVYNRSSSALTLPGFHTALEASLGSILTVRMGFTARYFWISNSGSFPNLRDPSIDGGQPGNKGPASTSGIAQQYSWGAGLSLAYMGFRLDGSFEAPFLTSGPDMIGGQAPGLFGQVSLSYNWK